MLAHALGGGVESHVADLRRLLSPTVDIDVLRPAGSATVTLEACNSDIVAWRSDDLAKLVHALRCRGYSRIHVHHVHGYSPEILDLPTSLRLPYDLTLHDFYPYCPISSLSTPSGSYCGEPDSEGCEVCIRARPHAWGWTIATWRDAMRSFLFNAERVIVPSAFVAGRILKHFPGLKIALRPHPPRADWITPPLARIKVALLGGLARVKGLDVLLACAREAKQNDQPLAFCLLGYPGHALPTWPDLPIQVRGEYTDRDLPALLALERADVIWFPGQIPETFSYTLDVALATRLPIVASALGAVGERLKGRSGCALLPADASSAVWNRALLSSVPPKSAMTWPDVRTQQRQREAYAEYLLLPLLGAPMLSGVADPASEAELQVDLPPACELPLLTLYEHGVVCGHRESLHSLKKRIGEIERDYELLKEYSKRAGKPWFEVLDSVDRDRTAAKKQFAEELARLQQRLTADAKDLAEVQAEMRQILASTSWRVTAPLRVLRNAFRSARHSAHHVWHQLRRAQQRIPLALQILRTQGPMTLARRVSEKFRAQSYRPVHQARPVLAEIGPLALACCPDQEQPNVSLVIPVYGQHEYTFNCLKSLADHTELAKLEIIVVDDASPTPLSSALADVSGIRLIRNEGNLGFIGSCHRGANLARGEFLVLLNNDIQVTAGWLNALLNVFTLRPDAGLVGARLVYPDGRLQEAGGIVWQDASAWNWGRGDDPERPPYRYLRAVDYCSGACLAMRRVDWLANGGFDRAFGPAYYEDTDLAFRVRAGGKSVYYQPEAKIYHFEGISSGTDESQGVKQHQVINRGIFLERWRLTLMAHRMNGVAPGLEANRGARVHVLVVEACMLTPDQDAGSLRMLAMLELMLGLGCQVSFVADNLECRQPYTRALQQTGVEVWHSPYVRSVAQLLEERGHCYDFIIFCRHYVAASYISRVRQWAPQARIVFDTVDLHYLREERQADLEQSPMLAAAAKKTRQKELDVIAKADVTLVVSTAEQELLAGVSPGAVVRILSTIHEVRESSPAFALRKGLLFVGGFRHSPNVDAMQWFLGEVWPLVRQRLPEIEITIVGSNMPDQVRALAGPGIIIAGFVEQVEPLIDAARISLAPLRYGAGVKGKINQAMASGLPVVATTMAIEGMGLEPGVALLVADVAQDFADAVVHLYSDEALWNRLAEGGRNNVRRYFSRSTARLALADLLGLGVGPPTIASPLARDSVAGDVVAEERL